MKDGTDWDDRNEKDQIDAATEAREAEEAIEGGSDEETRVADMDDLGLDMEEGEEGEEGQSPAVFGPTPVFGNARDLIDRYSHCVVCRSRLHFTHLTDFSRNLSQEIAKCPECNLKVRRVTHRLQ
jgi:hypothetical protein